MKGNMENELESMQAELDKCLAERDDAIYAEELAQRRVDGLTARERNSPRGAEALKALSATKEVSYQKMRAVELTQSKLEKLKAEITRHQVANEGNPMNKGEQVKQRFEADAGTCHDANEGNPMNGGWDNSNNKGNDSHEVGETHGLSDGNQNGMER